MRDNPTERTMDSSRMNSRSLWRERVEQMLGGDLEGGVAEILEVCLELMLENQGFDDEDDDEDRFGEEDEDDDDHPHSEYADDARATRGGAEPCGLDPGFDDDRDAPLDASRPDLETLVVDDGENLGWRLQRGLRARRRETLDPGYSEAPEETDAPSDGLRSGAEALELCFRRRLPTCLTTVTEVQLRQDVAQAEEMAIMPVSLRDALDAASRVAGIDEAGFETVHVEELVLRRTTVVHQTRAVASHVSPPQEVKLTAAPRPLAPPPQDNTASLGRAKRAAKRSPHRASTSHARQGRSTG